MANNIQRVFDFLLNTHQQQPQERLLASKHNGQWIPISSKGLIDKANALAAKLSEEGVGHGDRVAMVSFNRPEWIICDYALQFLGAVSVPLYPTISQADYQYILQEAEVKFIFCAGGELYDRIAGAVEGILPIERVTCFDAVGPSVPLFANFIQEGEALLAKHKTAIQQAMDKVQSADLLTIIYTSGTTGNPKGVMLTHANLVSNVQACQPLMPVTAGQSVLSFLPLCHVYERMLSYLYVAVGANISFAESMETIADNLKEVRPHFFTTVPRLLEKVYNKILMKGYALTGIKRGLFFWALKLGLRFEPQKESGWKYKLKLAIARKLIFSKWKEALGGRIETIASGGAALQPRLARVFWAAGITMVEGYGLTETSPVISFNHPNPKKNRVGTVGLVLDTLDVKLAPDGEILVKGPSIMAGYYKQPELTQAAFTEDGYFMTGDIGEWREGSYLKIKDRKKEMFKTSGGKYIAPQAVENVLKEILLVEQAMVIGEDKKFAAALIVPAWPAVIDWAALHDISEKDPKVLINHPKVLEKFQREIEDKNRSLGQVEKIKQFRLVPDNWAVETGELTPTMKLKRKVIMQKYAQMVHKIYEE